MMSGVITGSPRLFIAAILGVAFFLAARTVESSAYDALSAWDFGVFIYLVLAFVMMGGADEASLRRRANLQDTGRGVLLALMTVASLASLGAIVLVLNASKSLQGLEKAGHIGLAGATILLSWALIHTLFTLHYAHDFYGDDPATPDPDRRGGLEFSKTEQPDYWDFMYFSFTIGVTAQTSDTAVSTPRMRRLVLVHGVLSFFFNTVLLALTINIAAGLLS